MSDPSIRRANPLSFRMELTPDQTTNRENLEQMVTRFRSTRRLKAAQARFAFRMKTNGPYRFG